MEGFAVTNFIWDESFSLEEKKLQLSELGKLDSNYIHFSFVARDGKTIGENNEEIDLSQAETFKSAIFGKRIISDSIYNEKEDKLFMYLSVPVYSDSSRSNIIEAIFAIVNKDMYCNLCN